MNLFATLFILFLSTFSAWIILHYVFKEYPIIKNFSVAALGVFIFQAANYCYHGHADPFIHIAVIVSFPFSLIFAIIIECVYIKIENNELG